MQFLESSYCKPNRILLSCLGLWPYQKKKNCLRAVRTLACLLFLSELITQLMVFVTATYTLDILLEVLIFVMITFIYIINYGVFLGKMDKIRELLKAVDWNWAVLTCEEERAIFIQYAEKSRFLTIFLAVLFAPAVCAYMLFPYMSDILNFLTPQNETRPRRFLMLKEYFVDQEKYFYPLSVHANLVAITGSITIVAVEALFMFFVQHISSLFKITCYRIQLAMDEAVLNLPRSIRHIVIYKRIINAIRMHKTALELCDLLKGPLHPLYMMQVPCGVISLTVNLFKLFQGISNVHQVDAFAFHGLFIAAHVACIFYCNYLGQEIINHSSEVFVRAYDTTWYVTSTPVRKLLLVLMQKSLHSYTFVIGGIFIPSLEGFTSMTSTSLSYFMVLYSTRQLVI